MSDSSKVIYSIRRRTLFWVSFVFMLVVMALLNMDLGQLVTDAAPSGIVSFELAGSPEKAAQIIVSWDQRAQLYAAFGLGFDYLFMLTYATTISLACLWARDALREYGRPLALLGALFAGGLWLAAAFDAIENLALSVLLLEAVRSPFPEIARWCAIFKFTLIFLGLIYAFLGSIVFLISRILERQGKM